ncbi:S8 family serine peptidase [Mangrovimicrobium sediminis]|uniref:S8 family serine peptidase n=1 Tax=Mangrovimicrobium sediminis TaxID=2562682 RepID=UPI001F0E7C6A|nr:S8 family serine peptidase [Haliea sp. SAOS-164]
MPATPVRAQVPGDLTGSGLIDDQVEEEIDDQVEEEVVDEVADAVEESIDNQLDRLLLGPGDSFVEEQVEEEVEEQITDNVEEELQEETEQVVEENVEENVEETIEETVEEQIAETVTEELEDSVEASVEEAVESTVTDEVEEKVAETVESVVEEEVALEVETGVQEQVEADVETQVAENVEERVQETVAANAEARAAEIVEEQLDNEIDDILDDLEAGLEIDEERIHSDHWLVMAEPQVFEELAEEGYLFDTVTELPALGMRLAEVAGPSSFDITEVRRGVLDVVGKDRAEVDLNHIYTAGTELATVGEGVSPRTAANLPVASLPVVEAEAPRIGMIDSLVDTSHPALSAAHINSRTFVAEGAPQPSFHGTAIASIIAANDPEYQGLEPQAQIYAAAVFEQDPERGEIASTVSLLRALDWLIASHVDVINISLAGPPNRLLETALNRAKQNNMLILAAAGNGGPVAAPMYPAAYDSVVAVTAVDQTRRVFRLANRGTYLDIAAPGVGLLHARAGGGYVASSGTSFAVPFAATAAAALRRQHPGSDVMSELYRSAEDLGPPGRDEIYGYGLLRFSGS